MDVSKKLIIALLAAGSASALSDKAAAVVSSDNLRGSRGLQHVYDNGLSESFDDVDADNIDAKRPGINPDSGDEDYRVQDWVEDPSDGIVADSIVEGYNYTDYEWTYDGPLLSEPGNGLPPGSLNVCEGDCDDDLDCAAGLVCWYEDGSGRVPGCSGFPKEFWEYCIDPSVLPKRDVTHSNTLMDYGDGTGPASLGHCQGDCDYDIDCEGNNVCFYADGTGIVPGCDGVPTPSWEYCADPETIKEHRSKIGLENLESTDGYCPASIPYEGRIEMGKVNTTLANEVSGMVNGRRNPNVLYVHNDRNNAPRLMAIDKNNGRIVQNWNIGGINHTDYEDISNGPGPKAGVNYLHLCDIGDNPWDRQTIWIHRLPEPALTGPIGPKTFYPQTLTLRYPDGPKNAEACMVDPLTGLIYIIQKTRRTAQIYKTEKPWGDGDEMMDLVMAGTVTNLRKPARWGNALTGIDISPNGRDIVMLYYGGLDYRCRNENESIEDALGRFGLLVPSYIQEPNGGEAIAFASDMSGLYSCQEGGYDPEVPLYRYPATVAGLLTGRASNATPEPTSKPTNSPTGAPTNAPTDVPTTASPTSSPTTLAHAKEAAKQAEKIAKEAAKAEAERLKNEQKAAEALAKAQEEEKKKADEIALRTEKGETTSPTEAPITVSPTVSPVTSSPTTSPSAAPVTSSPTTSPSAAPVTSSPTGMPSPVPTTAPPTKNPSASPTVSPTPAPSKPPTPGPSASPTLSPTASPTSSPTNNPTNSPTPAPSPSPTSRPTKQPTNAPTTASPTSSPTPSPSAAPTTEAHAKEVAKLAEKAAKEAEKAEAERIKNEKKAAEAELRAKEEEEKNADDIALRTEGEEEKGKNTDAKNLEKATQAADGAWKELLKWQEKWAKEAKKKGGSKKGSGSKEKSGGSTLGNRNSAGSKPAGNRKSAGSWSDGSKQGSKKGDKSGRTGSSF